MNRRTFHFLLNFRSVFLLYILVQLKPCIAVANVDANTLINNELIRQQQQQQQIKEQFDTSQDIRIPQSQTIPMANTIPTNETPCFLIKQIILTGDQADKFNWTLKYADMAKDKSHDPATNRCLGVQGINQVMSRIQNAIIEKGFITTRVLAEPQNLSDGQLDLRLIPGIIKNIKHTSYSDEPLSLRATFFNAMPFQEGDLLNLRDIEQALENFKRLPTAEADIQITPSEDQNAQPGDSDLLISWTQTFPFRLSMSVDDSGSQSTGKYQGSLTLNYDHWWTLNDIFYLSYNHDLGGGEKGKRGSEGYAVHYSVPHGYWLLSLDAYSNTYHQSVPGLTQTNIYSGDSSTQSIKLGRLIFRNSQTKITLALSTWLRQSKNFIDDIEIEVQRRRMAGIDMDLDLTHFFNKKTLNLNFNYRQGLKIFGALPAPEESFNEGTGQPKIYKLNINFSTPIQLNKQTLLYANQIKLQKNDTPLVPQDRFSIGGRYTVRGFDGTTSLISESGLLIRNDLDYFIPRTQHRLFIGLDYGQVFGPSSKYLLGTELTGGVIGLRGNFKSLNYELFAGKPILMPEGFQTSHTTSGFNLFWSI